MGCLETEATDEEVERDVQVRNCSAGEGRGVRFEGPFNRAGLG